MQQKRTSQPAAEWTAMQAIAQRRRRATRRPEVQTVRDLVSAADDMSKLLRALSEGDGEGARQIKLILEGDVAHQLEQATVRTVLSWIRSDN